MDQIKILQINSGSKEYGGVSSILFNIFQKIDKGKFMFDFLTPEFTTYNLRRTDIESMGGQIFDFEITDKKFKKLFKTVKNIKRFISNNHYDIVHINSGSFIFNLVVSVGIKLSKKNPKIIVHSHNSLEDKVTLKSIVINLLKPLLLLSSDYQIACSLKAAESMYPKKYLDNVHIFLNAVDLNRFKFDMQLRDSIRNKMGLNGDNILVGNIGRLSYQKNQLFLLKIFKEVVDINPNFKLVILGKGPEYENLTNYIKENELQSHVYLVDETNNVNAYYSAFDLFVLPSRFEGLPLVGIEAQAMGLKIVASDAITKEVKITPNVDFVSLNDRNKWINSILNSKINSNRTSNKDELKKSGYMIDDVVKKYEEFYLNILRKEKI
jgi:glycosyltransferase involved in cell wall biosynthesis